MATAAVAGHMRQQFENDQEKLEQDLWSEYDKLKKTQLALKSSNLAKE